MTTPGIGRFEFHADTGREDQVSPIIKCEKPNDRKSTRGNVMLKVYA